VPISTSLSLQALLKAAVARSGMSVPTSRIAGLTQAAQALAVAGAGSRTATVLLVVPGDADVDRMTSDVRFFVAAIEGLSHSAVEQVVLPFPSLQIDPYRALAPHFRVASARARALHALASGTSRVVVASAAALLPRVSPPARLLSASLELKPGQDISPQDLAAVLVDGGFTREDPVDAHGEYCVRGGIVDVYPAGEAQPARLEFVGDTIESIRRYDPATQRSITPLDQLAVVPLREAFDGLSASASFFDYLPDDTAIYVSERDEVTAQALKVVEQISASYEEVVEAKEDGRPEPGDLFIEWQDIEREFANSTELNQLAVGETERDRHEGSLHIGTQPAPEFRGRIADWAADVRRARERGETVLFVAAGVGRAERTVEILTEYELRGVQLDRADDLHGAAVLVATGDLSRGFRLPAADLQIFAESDVFEEDRRQAERRRSLAQTFLSDLRDLKPGDLVVHVDHGIGKFVGLKQIALGAGSSVTQEFMELRYAGEDKLFVPVERLDLVQKYSGATHPPLDRLGGTSWERAKTRVRKAMRDMAEELLKLYAARKAVSGHAFNTDTHWQQEFEDAFEYELTPDQAAAITDIKKNMEQPFPMDRLLCGDVGYGKTEVAMRAAFKAVMDGKQVAFLAPTTVLAFQHLKTLKERLAGFPIAVDMVSRFRTKAEQTQILGDLTGGKVDIIVGTHRLLSKDVSFRDLGLLVVDEEQRFGVAHKEKIKQLRHKVDVLTMSATPIPRTLNMSLAGIRDMSIIETPPKDRLSIQTNVVKFDQQVISRAIRNELARGGQIYFVHNRVESIFSIGNLITKLVPEARVAVAHGQMGEEELERAMMDFIAQKHDVLLATTIIENGLDIPNVNTIIVNRADRYGLSQLYQLRGRVGRSDRPAYAYLLIPPEDSLSPVARKRLAAIKEFSDLGSGFRVAALDLEIRGAGTLLGGEQSGHIESVGFEMYMKLLEQAVRELKGEEPEEEVRAVVNLRVDLRIDDTYVPDMNQRLIVYRRIAAARTERELEEALAEVKDRYGEPPASVLQLVDYGQIRVLADRLGIESIDRDGQVVHFKFRPQTKVDPTRLVALVRARPGLALSPPVTLKLDLRQVVPMPADRDAPPTGPQRIRPKGSKKIPGSGTSSWWTTRATSGTVEPGFSREEILKPQKEDPRGPHGVLTLVGDLLRALAAAHQGH
jgi:transcription-repair coupling factor (superfamily II helicase)